MKRLCLAVFAAALAMAAPAAANVLFDSGEPTSVGANCYCNDQFFAGALSFDDGAAITDIEGFIFGTGVGRISVHANLPENLPGAVLFTDTFSLDVPQESAGWFGVHGLSWGLPSAGVYWFSFTTDWPATGFGGGIYTGAPKRTIWAIDRGPAYGWERLPGFQGITLRVSGEGDEAHPFRAGAVPEPAGWALLITGFAGLGAGLRRRRRLAAG